MDDLLTFLLSALILFGGIIGFFCLVNYLVNNTPKAKQERAEQERAERMVQQKRMEKEKKYGVPRTAPLTWLNDNGVRYSNRDEYYIWKDKNNIKILGYHLLNDEFHNIPIDDIKFFKLEGELRTETTIEGGGINKKGLVGGAIIGGAVGAVIGSKGKVTTKKETIDTRKGIIYLILNGEERILHMDYAAYKTFKRLIPTKDYDVVMFNNMQKQNV